MTKTGATDISEMQESLRGGGFIRTSLRPPTPGLFRVAYRSYSSSLKTARSIWVDFYEDGSHSVYYSMSGPYRGSKSNNGYGPRRPPPAPGTSPIGFTTIDEMLAAINYARRSLRHAPCVQEIEDRHLQDLACSSIGGNSLTMREQRILARFVHAELLGKARGYPVEYLSFRRG